MDELIIVSSDGHAQMPPELWPEYLERRYHEFLPRLYEEADVYPGAIWPLARASMTLPGLVEEHTTGGFRGVHDAGVRLAQMDREGISAETIYPGDHRKTELMFNIMNGVYPLDAWDAGARAHNRWVVDEFGLAGGRFLLAGGIGSCSDMDATVAELEWIADHGFVGTFCPGFLSHPALPPLFDDSWEPFWSTCAARGLAVFVHAGFGWMQGDVYPEVERIYTHWRSSGASESELMAMLTTDVFNGEFFADVKPRRPMWQLMLGGVFDRHPELKFVLTEVRADWIPALLRHLDAIYDERRDELPASRRPSEYWSSNCLAGASFVHRAEVEMRQEIGVETISFGRDYPHPEGTWPYTIEFLRAAFAGVPETELRLMLGENAIRFLGLDRDRLAAVAARVGPAVADVMDGAEVAPELVENFDLRSGYLKPAEGDAKLAAVDVMLRDDLERVGAR
jgi:predicted TIM-barrel fold metal-dependent hydrolase